MDKQQKQRLMENAREIQKLINEYEELEYAINEDEHATTLGI
jgi:hypothetical protein